MASLIVLDGVRPQKWSRIPHAGSRSRTLVSVRAVPRVPCCGRHGRERRDDPHRDDDGDMRDYLDQLERLRSRCARRPPAHGEPIDDPAALFERYVVPPANARGQDSSDHRARAGGVSLDDIVPARVRRRRRSGARPGAAQRRSAPREARARGACFIGRRALSVRPRRCVADMK